jgi:hypothetical protein
MTISRLALVPLVIALLLVGCSAGRGGAPGATSSRAAAAAPSSAPPSADAPSGDTGLPRPDHVMVVIFENEDVENVLGSPDAPYLTQLAASGATMSDAHAETHPSEPNYLALFSGSTQGVTDDSCPLTFSGDNLAAQLRAAGETFVGYAEGLPEAGFAGCRSGDYARKHNPWANFPALPAEVNQPLSALPSDFADLPTVAFVVPNLCHDMHDCGVAAGDAWARSFLPRYVAWAADHDSQLIVTFDEDDGSAANHIATFVVGAGVRRTTSGQLIDHYSLLRTMEQMYGLPAIGEAAQAEPITGIWTA